MKFFSPMKVNARQSCTFFEAWESMGVAAADGYSNHMFSIDYTCVKCKSACKALPFLSGLDFICSTCNLELESIDR